MRFLSPLAPADAPAARLNPVAKFGAVLVVSLVVLASLDPVTPAVTLLVVCAAVPFTGLRFDRLLRRAWPLLLGAVLVGVANILFAGDTPGAVLLAAGPLRVTTGGLALGGALALRVLAIAVPGVVAFASTDPTDLADSLMQQLRVPARFAIGALAAYRLMPLLAEEWELLTLARRARGVDAGRNPVARVRLFAGTLFGLLVGAVRRGTRLAVAMDARGFDSGMPRSTARRLRMRRADLAVLLGGVALAGAALGSSVALGTFRPLIG